VVAARQAHDLAVRVQQLMTTEVVTVKPETTLKDVAELLCRHRISGLPVCDQGVVVGVVSEGDIVQKEQGPLPQPGFFHRLRHANGKAAKLSARTAGEAMSAPPIVIDADENVTEAARLIVEHQVNRLPVVRAGRLVGIVTRADLVRAFHRTDEQIQAEIEDSLRRALWVDPRRIDLEVEHGEVSLAGEVENRSEARLIQDYVGRVPGVVAMHSELTWELDDLGRRAAASANHLPRRI
jgi:CBS domain-containing protein